MHRLGSLVFASILVAAVIAPRVDADSSIASRLRLPTFDAVCVVDPPQTPEAFLGFAVARGYLGAAPNELADLSCTLPMEGWQAPDGHLCFSGGPIGAPYVPDLMDEIVDGLKAKGHDAKVQILEETDDGYPTRVRITNRTTGGYIEIEQKGTRTTILVHQDDGTETIIEFDGWSIVRFIGRQTNPRMVVIIDFANKRGIIIDKRGRIVAEMHLIQKDDGTYEYVIVRYEYGPGKAMRVTVEKTCVMPGP